MSHKKIVITCILCLIIIGGFLVFNTIFKPLNSLPGETLVDINYFGGLCPNGPCGSHSSIKSNGLLVKNGTNITFLTSSQISNLENLINATDFDQLMSKKPIKTCEAASDGTSVAYTFYKSGKQITISACDVYIDYNSPLFKDLGDLSQKYILN